VLIRPLPPINFPSTTLIRLYEFLKNNSQLSSANPSTYIQMLGFAFDSVSKVWWRMTGSNRRPPACKAGALPAELIPRIPLAGLALVGLVGFEPTTPALSRRCSNRLSYRPTHPFSKTVSPASSTRQPACLDNQGHLDAHQAHALSLTVVCFTADKCGCKLSSAILTSATLCSSLACKASTKVALRYFPERR